MKKIFKSQSGIAPIIIILIIVGIVGVVGVVLVSRHVQKVTIQEEIVGDVEEIIPTQRTIQGETVGDVEEIIPINVEGKVGEKLANARLELIVDNFEFFQGINGVSAPVDSWTGTISGFFVVLDLTIKNNLEKEITKNFNDFILLTERFDDKIGVRYSKKVMEVIEDPINLKNIKPNEERKGKLVFTVSNRVRNLRLKLEDKRYKIKGYRKEETGDYGTIIVRIFEHKFTQTLGNVGETITNDRVDIELTVNSVEYVQDLTQYPEIEPGELDLEKAWGDWYFVVLDITIKNLASVKRTIPDRYFGRAGFRHRFLIMKEQTTGGGGNRKFRAATNAFDENRLNLINMKPNEKRTGKVVFSHVGSPSGEETAYLRYFDPNYDGWLFVKLPNVPIAK